MYVIRFRATWKVDSAMQSYKYLSMLTVGPDCRKQLGYLKYKDCGEGL